MSDKDSQDYTISCEMCDVDTDVLVFDIDEKPLFCPMCGAEVESVPV